MSSDSATAELQYTDATGVRHRLELDPGKSVLDTVLESGIDAQCSCLAGICQTCMMECENPEALPEQSQEGLTSEDMARNYFLPCITYASKTIHARSLASLKPIVKVRVLEKEMLNEQVLRLRVQAGFGYKAGQFCNLFKTDDLSRAYSIASAPSENQLEFHIKRLDNGQFSAWAADELNVDDKIGIQGPFGNCIYERKYASSPLLLCGIGTGLAPLIGIVRQALESGHQEAIHLVLGAREAGNFYLREQLAELAVNNPGLSIHWVAQNSAGADDVTQGDIYNYVTEQFGDLSAHQTYLCGALSFVEKMTARCLDAGATKERILSDAFVPAASQAL